MILLVNNCCPVCFYSFQRSSYVFFVLCSCSSPFTHILQNPHHYFFLILNQLVLTEKITLRNFKNINKKIFQNIILYCERYIIHWGDCGPVWGEAPQKFFLTMSEAMLRSEDAPKKKTLSLACTSVFTLFILPRWMNPTSFNAIYLLKSRRDFVNKFGQSFN